MMAPIFRRLETVESWSFDIGASRETLLALNYPIEWQEYAMGHQVCPQEIADIATWLNQIYRSSHR